METIGTTGHTDWCDADDSPICDCREIDGVVRVRALYKGFSAPTANAAVARAIAEEGQARSLWDIVNGLTAEARDVPFQDQRVALEQRAGDLMKVVAA